MNSYTRGVKSEELVWYGLKTMPQREGEAQLLLTGNAVPTPRNEDGTFPMNAKGEIASKPPKMIRPKAQMWGNGIVVMCPLEEVWRKANRTTKKKRLTVRPLMRGWLLAGFPVDRPNWFFIRTRCLITGVAGSDGKPRRIHWRAVNKLRRIGDVGVLKAPDYEAYMRSRQEFEQGDLCEVAEGPLTGQQIRVAEIKGRYAVCMLDFMGETTAHVPLEKLIKVA